MVADGLTIGELARRGGVAATTLRYYEQIALLPAPARVGGRRRYSEGVLRRLEVIRLCKVAGFTLDEIALLFADEAQGRPHSQALAQRKLAEIESRMAELARARDIIEWGVACTCPSIDTCSCSVHGNAQNR
jgi:DNA-binding transcriptional MerR regulator